MTFLRCHFVALQSLRPTRRVYALLVSSGFSSGLQTLPPAIEPHETSRLKSLCRRPLGVQAPLAERSFLLRAETVPESVPGYSSGAVGPRLLTSGELISAYHPFEVPTTTHSGRQSENVSMVEVARHLMLLMGYLISLGLPQVREFPQYCTRVFSLAHG